jgi:amino acid transporter
MSAKSQGQRCRAKTKSGKPCQAAATEGGLCFFHANPNKASELGRIGGRSNRHSVTGSADPLPKLETAMAVREAVGKLIADVYAYGFEACADVAEETANAQTQIPLAMRRTIYIGVSASIFVCLALILSLPDIEAVIRGQDADPIGTILRGTFGTTGSRLVLGVVLVSFISCILSLQAAVSRLLFSFARDRMIFGSAQLGKLSARNVPSFALATGGLIPAVIVCIGYFLQDALATIVSFAVAGIYISFQMIVAGALYARFVGWKPSGPFRIGRFATLINVAALIYGVCAIADILWPQSPAAPWYVNYAIPFTTVVVIATGALYMVVGRPYESDTTHGASASTIRIP